MSVLPRRACLQLELHSSNPFAAKSSERKDHGKVDAYASDSSKLEAFAVTVTLPTPTPVHMRVSPNKTIQSVRSAYPCDSWERPH